MKDAPMYVPEHELLEQLASIEHERWSDWQKWCHQVLRENNPSPEQGDILERWDRQIETPYAELSEREKHSDRVQVARYWPLIQSYVDRKVLEGRIDELEHLKAAKGRFTTSGYGLWVDNEINNRIAELQADQEGEV